MEQHKTRKPEPILKEVCLLVPLCVPSQSWGMAEVGILDDEKVPESV